MQDVFSLGCVIAELFLEGKALFDLSKVSLAHSSKQQICMFLLKTLKPKHKCLSFGFLSCSFCHTDGESMTLWATWLR